MKPEFKLAVVQIRTETDQIQTMHKAKRMIAQAASNGAELVVLPEMWNCPYSKKYFHAVADNDKGESRDAMSRWAQENGIILVGGSVPEKCGDKLYNTCYVFDETGREIARHRKIHLFDVDIKGGVRFKESHSFAPGEDITVFDTRFGRMGVEICFDIRFPELTRAMQVHSQRVFSKPISVRIGRKMGTTMATMPIQSMNMPMKNMRAIMKMKQPHLPMPTVATKF